MAVTITTRPETLLVAFRRPDPEGPVVVAAHLTQMVEHFDDATGRHEPQKEIPAAAVSLPEVDAVVGEALGLLVAERTQLQADHAAAVEALQTAHAADLATRDQARQAAEAELRAAHEAELQAREDARVADLAAAAEAGAQAVAAKDAVIAQLEAQIAELTAPPAEAVVSKMQAVLALDSIDAGMGLTLLDVVELQVAQASRRTQLYWRNASHLHRNHPELLAMIAELGWSDAFVDGLFALGAGIV